eukprot:scaffold131291_cov35-Attheya_sp.AAC.1
MCAALNCPVWRLQNSLVAPRRLGDDDDEYTAMVRGLVYLAGCFHPTIKKIRWISSSEDGGTAGSELVGQ